MNTIYEGARHAQTCQALGLTIAPYANFSEVSGINAPSALGNPKGIARDHARYLNTLPDGALRIIDCGGWPLLRSLLTSRSGNVEDICYGLDSGVLPCDGELALLGAYFKALRRQHGIAMNAIKVYVDPEVYPKLPQTPFNNEPQPFGDVLAAYLGGRTIAPRELQRRSQQMIVNTLVHLFALCGVKAENVIVFGCCNVDTYGGDVLAVNCPVNHVIAGGFFGGIGWDQHWLNIRGVIERCINLTHRPIIIHLDAEMPIEQAARGITLARQYNVDVIMFCDNSLAPEVLAPRISALSQISLTQ